MTKEQLAEEAKRIRENDAARHIIDEMRKDALEALASVDATDADEIRQHQAMVRVCDEFFSRLEGLILDGQPKAKPGIA